MARVSHIHRDFLKLCVVLSYGKVSQPVHISDAIARHIPHCIHRLYAFRVLHSLVEQLGFKASKQILRVVRNTCGIERHSPQNAPTAHPTMNATSIQRRVPLIVRTRPLT